MPEAESSNSQELWAVSDRIHSSNWSYLNRSKLIRMLKRLDEKIKQTGFSRHDPTDARSHPFFLFFERGIRRYLGRPLLLWEWFMPWFWRRLLGIQSKVVPTALYHVGMTHLYVNQISPRPFSTRIEQICEEALELSLDGTHLAWEHPYALHAYGWRLPSLRRSGIPPSCAHHTARLGLLLLRAGRAQGRLDFIDAARSAADALLDYHRWHHHDDGTSAVSYYPDSNDEVINTGAEVALLLAELPPDRRSAEHERRARRLFRMVVKSQREDGLWDYVTEQHAEALGPSGGADAHHNAMILGALARVATLRLFDENDKAVALQRTIVRGTEAFLDSFVERDGSCRLHPGSGRLGGLLDYSEGLLAMNAVASTLNGRNGPLVVRIERLVPLVVKKMVDTYYLPEEEEVATYKRFGKLYSVGSISCGSGPFMETIASTLAWPQVAPWRAVDEDG